MLAATRSYNVLMEYSTLHNVKPAGGSVGLHEGREIAARVVDVFGRHFAYSGVAPRREDGRIDVEALKKGEFVLMPNLLYSYVT